MPDPNLSPLNRFCPREEATAPPPLRVVWPATQAQPSHRAGDRTLYIRLLTWAFTLFNAIRIAAYLPTAWAIYASGDSSQHSLWTWFTWFGANATMAAWLHEHNGRQMNRAVAINIGNASMCLATGLLIAAFRF